MTTILSPPRSAKSATAMASPSPNKSSATNNNSNNSRLSAAADLIRNLDAALLEMTNSAAKSADDAARARRNAKTAGEVSEKIERRIICIMHEYTPLFDEKLGASIILYAHLLCSTLNDLSFLCTCRWHVDMENHHHHHLNKHC